MTLSILKKTAFCSEVYTVHGMSVYYTATNDVLLCGWIMEKKIMDMPNPVSVIICLTAVKGDSVKQTAIIYIF
jgi:hypothetical protein